MYTKRETAYAEPCHKLLGGGIIDYQMQADTPGITEVACPTEDLIIDRGGIARWGGGMCALRVRSTDTYESLKARLVKLRYSLDDQIAIMLNGDEQEMQRMQAWRDWAAVVAEKIMTLIEIQK